MGERFDLVVIGGGSAARDAANTAAREHGATVALVERERWGGSCPNVACSPTKAYLVAAELAHDVNELAPRMGVEAGPARIDLAGVRAWKETLKRTQDEWVAMLMEQGYATYTGEASFLDPHRVRVGELVLEAERILVASGAGGGWWKRSGSWSGRGRGRQSRRSTASTRSAGSTTSRRSS